MLLPLSLLFIIQADMTPSLGLWQQKVVKVMGIACILAYIALVLELFGHCTPIQRNWQIRPYAGNHCTLTVTNYIMTASLNVLYVPTYYPFPSLLADSFHRTDIGILSIPIPLLWKVRLPLSRKIVIVLLLSSGIFVITAALLRCILTLQDVSQSVQFFLSLLCLSLLHHHIEQEYIY